MPIFLLVFLLAPWLPAYSRPQWITIQFVNGSSLQYDYNSIKANGTVRSVTVSHDDDGNRAPVTWNIDCKSWMMSVTVYGSTYSPYTGDWFPIGPSTKGHAVADNLCPK
jgi:hypothetical protein